MYQNAMKCLSDVFGWCRSFTIDSNSSVYDHNNDEDFLNAWEEMLDKYGLRINSWLQRQFELREKWVLVNGRSITIFYTNSLCFKETRVWTIK